MDFYKITNQHEIHEYYKIQTGINKTKITFSSEHIFAFIEGGYWIRKVILPIEAQVTCKQNKDYFKYWETGSVILMPRIKLNFDIIIQLIQEGAIVTEQLLKWAIINNEEDLTKFLLKFPKLIAKSFDPINIACEKESVSINILKELSLYYKPKEDSLNIIMARNSINPKTIYSDYKKAMFLFQKGIKPNKSVSCSNILINHFMKRSGGKK